MNLDNINDYPPGYSRLYSGAILSLYEKNYHEIDIRDLAAGLSKRPRWAGQTEYFYSVAEHSIECYRLAQQRNLPLRLQFQALMHDVSEALIGDMAKPWKPLFWMFVQIENELMEAFSKDFGFPWPMTPEVKEIDVDMMHWEWEKLVVEKKNISTDYKLVEMEFLRCYNEVVGKLAEEYNQYLGDYC